MRPLLRVRLPAALAAALALACGDEPAIPEPGPRPVKIFEVGGAEAGRRLEYPGEVESVQHAEMGFEVAGRIVEFPVDEGQSVEAGEVLAKLDPRDFEAKLDAERARVRSMQTEFERARTLVEKDVAPQQDLDRARRNLEVSQANLRTAEKALEDSVLRAPFAGVVARKLVRDFRNVQAKEAVLILEDQSGLQLVVNIPERDWVYARGRQQSTPRSESERLSPQVQISNYPDRNFPAHFSEVATTADPTTRTYAVTLRYEVPDELNVLPGMTAKAILHAPAEVTGAEMLVPARAVLEDGSEGPSVWIVDPESMQVSRAPVELGELSGDRVEIRRGLSPGQWIAVSGVHQLREGVQVRRFGD